jgi:hypothetical protein
MPSRLAVHRRRKPRWPDQLPRQGDPVLTVAGFRDRLASLLSLEEGRGFVIASFTLSKHSRIAAKP